MKLPSFFFFLFLFSLISIVSVSPLSVNIPTSVNYSLIVNYTVAGFGTPGQVGFFNNTFGIVGSNDLIFDILSKALNTSTINAKNITIEHKATMKSVNITNQLYIGGNLSVKRPYIMLSDNTTQTMGQPNVPIVVNFSTVEDEYYANIEGKQNISVWQTGDYRIDISAIFTVDSPNVFIQLWVQKTNSTGQFVDVPRSNTRMQLPSATTEVPLAVPFILDLKPTDKFRIMMATDNAGSQLVYTTNTSYSPETPSIILTLHKISEVTD